MSEYNGTDPIYKIVILSMRKEQLEEPVRVLGDRVKFCVQGEDSYGYINGELHGPEFDKGSECVRSAKHFHFRQRTVLRLATV